jgi:hypothetical protein
MFCQLSGNFLDKVDDKWSTNAEGRIAVSKIVRPPEKKPNMNKREEMMPPIIPIRIEIKKGLYFSSVLILATIRPKSLSNFFI